MRDVDVQVVVDVREAVGEDVLVVVDNEGEQEAVGWRGRGRGARGRGRARGDRGIRGRVGGRG